MSRSHNAVKNTARLFLQLVGPGFSNVLDGLGGTNNNTLIDYLVRRSSIYTPLIEQVLRAVDRGNYCPDHGGLAYKDIPWESKNLDLLAPSVYSQVMEALELTPGLSFLNLGSGSGYLNTMVGLILGPYGINHGIELCTHNVNFAKERLCDFIENASAIDEYDFCEPTFFEGNCFLLDDTSQKYDRVFCGAGCPEEYTYYVKNLIKVGGILVMPLNHEMLKMTRIEESTWSTTKLLYVPVAPLITPPSLTQDESPKYVKISNFFLPKLKHVCRSNIRAILKKNIDKDYPNLKNKTLLEMKQRSPNITISSSIDSGISSRISSSGISSLSQIRPLRYSLSELESTLECLNENYSSSADNNDDSLDIGTLDGLLAARSSKKLTSDELIAWKHIPRNSDSEMEEDSKNDNIAKDNVKKDIENGDSYTEHMIKRIASLPLPSDLIKYVNNYRNNL